MKIRIDAGGISFTANEEQVREPVLMNAERIPLKLEIWIYKAMVEKLSRTRECEITFDLEDGTKKAWYIPTVTPCIDGDYHMVEFEKYNKPGKKEIAENDIDRAYKEMVLESHLFYEKTKKSAEKIADEFIKKWTTPDNKKEDITTHKTLNLENLPKLEVKDGVVYLDGMALTSLQKIGIKHDVTGDRITRLNIELLVDFEGLI